MTTEKTAVTKLTKKDRSIGDNSVDGKELMGFIERIESLNEEIDELRESVGDIKKEAKAKAFDTKTIDKIIRRRKLDKEIRDMEDEILAAYERAIRM